MKSITVHHRFSAGLPEIRKALRPLLDEDRRAQPSWSPDGSRVCVVYDTRGRLTALFSKSFSPEILDIRIHPDGMVSVECASSALFDFSGSRRRLAVTILGILGDALNEPMPPCGPETP